MIMDPGQKSKVKLAEAWQDAEIEVTKLMVDWLGSDEGKGVLREAAGVMVGDCSGSLPPMKRSSMPRGQKK